MIYHTSVQFGIFAYGCYRNQHISLGMSSSYVHKIIFAGCLALIFGEVRFSFVNNLQRQLLTNLMYQLIVL